MLAGQWGEDPGIAGFQHRAFEEILTAWHGEGNPQLVISADTGSGKTEAACLPMITAAAADRTPVKLAIAVTPDLHHMLQQYAALYAAAYGREESVADLVPAMLAAFLESDRRFARSRSTGK